MGTNPSPMETDIIPDNNRMEFGMRMARHMILNEINNASNVNLVLSPLSLHILLNMVASEAKGRTLDQLLRYLQSESTNYFNSQSSQMMALATSSQQFLESENVSNLISQSSQTTQQGSSGRRNTEGLFATACSAPYGNFYSGSPFGTSNSFSGVNSFPAPSYSPFASAYGSFSSSTSSSNQGPIICFVNGIWVDHRFPMKSSFKQLAEDVYKAKAETVDFKNKAEQVRNGVNLWAEKETKGLIRDLLPHEIFKKDTILVLANALYFKGTWLYPFETSNTKNEVFHLLNGQTLRDPFMKSYTEEQRFYGTFEGFKVLKLPYKSGKDKKQFSMCIVLPNKKDGLKELIQQFNTYPRLLHEHLVLEQVKLSKMWIPKLKFSYNLMASRVMKELGLNLPFELNGELTGIVDSPLLYVSDVVQKSYIEVNEEGTVAAAFGACSLGFGCARYPPPSPSFVADHPFMFMIKEELSGIVLFTGAVLNPLMA